MFIKLLFILLLSVNSFCLDVVATLPEFNWAVKELAPSLDTVSLLNGNEDPHFIDATPSFIFKIAKTKMIIRNGLELEDAWLNKVIEQAGNSNINKKRNCDASTGIVAIDTIKDYDRSMGDVHASGNPHYTLSPLRMISVVDTIHNCLKNNFSGLKSLDENLKKLKKNLQALHTKIKSIKFKNNFYVYHREFSYLAKDYGLKLLESIEKTPGILPSATYLLEIAKKTKVDKPVLVLASNNASSKILDKFKEMSSVNYKKMKIHPTKDESYIVFIKSLIENIK